MTTLPVRSLYVSMVTSLDGFIEGPNHELDWFDNANPQFHEYCEEMIDSVGFALYGRRAYELMVQYWPNAERQAKSAQALAFAQRMNALPKLVLSRTLKEASWSNTRVVGDTEEIAKLKREPGKPIVAWAGASMATALSAAGLVDEYRLVVHPIALGGGTPLFTQRLQLRQVRSQSLDGRLSVLCYEPER
jgi:dihydrofolate reductase